MDACIWKLRAQYRALFLAVFFFARTSGEFLHGLGAEIPLEQRSGNTLGAHLMDSPADGEKMEPLIFPMEKNPRDDGRAGTTNGHVVTTNSVLPLTPAAQAEHHALARDPGAHDGPGGAVRFEAIKFRDKGEDATEDATRIFADDEVRHRLVVTTGAAAAPTLPHGLAPHALSEATRQHLINVVHAAAASFDEAEACGRRLAHLRSLVGDGHLKEALEASFALHEHFQGGAAGNARRPAHADCNADIVHVGEGTIATMISTPADRGGNPAAVPVHSSFVTLHSEDGSAAPAVALPIHLGTESGRRVPMSSGPARVPVVGFSLDGRFVLAESHVRCRAATTPASSAAGDGVFLCDGGARLRDAPVASAAEAQAELVPLLSAGRRLSPTFMSMPAWPTSLETGGGPKLALAGLPDADSVYAVGAKTVIVIPVLPSDGIEADVAPKGYNYGLVASTYGGSIRSYLAAVMSNINDFYSRNSFNEMTFVTTVTEAYNVNYLSANCRSVKSLDFWAGKASTSMDMMAYAAAAAHNPTTAFDFQVVFIPKCTGLGYSGVGWVGVPGTLQNLGASDLDPSVSHELGHNLGANHASIIVQGARGAVAWGVDTDAGWVEYGNPHTTMGKGGTSTDFLLEGKSVFDWIGSTEVAEVIPFDAFGIGQCNPCGPYQLQPTDTGSYPGSSTLGLQIYTATDNRYGAFVQLTFSSSNSVQFMGCRC